MSTFKRSSMTIDNIESERGSVRDVREYLCPPQVIKDLEIGQCIMLTKSPSSLHFLKLRDVRMSEAFGHKVKLSELQSIKDLLKDNPILKSNNQISTVHKPSIKKAKTGIENFYKEGGVSE